MVDNDIPKTLTTRTAAIARTCGLRHPDITGTSSTAVHPKSCNSEINVVWNAAKNPPA